MNTEHVTLHLPLSLYQKLQSLAEVEHTDPMGVIEKLITNANSHQNWLRNLRSLRQQIQEDGNFGTDMTKEDLIKQLRRTRQEIFETEYASQLDLTVSEEQPLSDLIADLIGAIDSQAEPVSRQDIDKAKLLKMMIKGKGIC